jgi:NHS family xanthosine MFS transporter
MQLLNKYNFDVQKHLHLYGWELGFIVAMWITNLTDWKSNTNQFVLRLLQW